MNRLSYDETHSTFDPTTSLQSDYENFLKNLKTPLYH